MPAVADMTIADRLAAIKAAGFWTPEEAARFDALRAASYVLVRIDGVGERWRCRRCNGRHTHFTLMCVERPFRGLLDGLHAYWANIGDAGVGSLSAAQRQRLDVLTPIFGGQPVPLGTAHPRMAAHLATDERDILVGSTVLGSLDPITPARARLLVETINFRARRQVLAL